ncbi:MAG: hypothetical protein ABI947_01665 [Chloroflexota bacterium]
MPKLMVVNNDYATLVYYPETQIVHHTFHKPMVSEEFRAVLNAGIDLLEKHKATKWLSDDRGNGALSEADTEWSMTNWFPRAVEAGWKFWALVVPADFMARLNLQEFVDSYYEKGLRIMVFVDPEAALTWLETL